MISFDELQKEAYKKGSERQKKIGCRGACAEMAAKSFAEGYVKGYLSEIKKYVEDGSLSLQKVLTDLGITEKRFLELTSPEKE